MDWYSEISVRRGQRTVVQQLWASLDMLVTFLKGIVLEEMQKIRCRPTRQVSMQLPVAKNGFSVQMCFPWV